MEHWCKLQVDNTWISILLGMTDWSSQSLMQSMHLQHKWGSKWHCNVHVGFRFRWHVILNLNDCRNNGVNFYYPLLHNNFSKYIHIQCIRLPCYMSMLVCVVYPLVIFLISLWNSKLSHLTFFYLYSASGKYSKLSTLSTFYYMTALFQNGLS